MTYRITLQLQDNAFLRALARSDAAFLAGDESTADRWQRVARRIAGYCQARGLTY